MKIVIRDWDQNFERDRTKQWKRLEWVPIPNKQGIGYRKIMKQPNGPEIYGCWVALVTLASTCTPRGDLSKYSTTDLSDMTLIDHNRLVLSIKFLSQTLDWIEVIEDEKQNLDTSVKNLDIDVSHTASSSSILFNSSISNESSNNSSIKSLSDNINSQLKSIDIPLTVFDSKQSNTWKTSYDIYVKIHDEEYSRIVSDNEWIEKLKHLNPSLNILLSLENAKEYWRSEEGWKYKKKQKTKDLNWEATYRNAVRMPMNRVFLEKGSVSNPMPSFSKFRENQKQKEVPQEINVPFKRY